MFKVPRLQMSMIAKYKLNYFLFALNIYFVVNNLICTYMCIIVSETEE